MKRPILVLHLALMISFLAATGCVSLTTQPGSVIGTLRVSGPSVWLNSSMGRDGDPVLIGSTVATGAGSSAIVEFRDGGYLQLDENTDPFFDWLEQSKCILVRMLKGQAYLKRDRACVEGPNISLVLNSEANFIVERQPAVTEVTLLRGRADVSVPATITLLPGQQFIASGGRIAALRTLSPAELRGVVAWRRNYRFVRTAPPEVPSEIEPFGTTRPRPPYPGHPRGTETTPAPSGESTTPPPSTGTTVKPGTTIKREMGVPPSLLRKSPGSDIR